MEENYCIRLPLKVDGLELRRVVAMDVDDLAEYWSDQDCARYQFWEPRTISQIDAMICEQSEAQVGDPGTSLNLAALFDEKLIGDCQLTFTNPFDRTAELGFAINPKFAGRGLATKFVTATLGFGFMQLNLHRVVAGTDVRNDRSWKLMERIGMRREGHFLQEHFVKGEWVDSFSYAMLSEEWQSRYPALISLVSSNESY